MTVGAGGHSRRPQRGLPRLEVWPGPAVLAAAALAASLHMQPTIAILGAPVRLSLSDAVLALIFPYVAWLSVKQRDFLRDIPASALLWIGAGSLVMTVGLAIGVHADGALQQWTLVKYAGWYALLYYAAAGYVLARAEPRAVASFALTLVVIHAALLFVDVPLVAAGRGWPGPLAPRMTGFFANPNAYGFSLLCAIALLLACGEMFCARIGRTAWVLLNGLLCAGVLLSQSVGALIGLVILACAWAALTRGRHIPLLLRIGLAAWLIYAVPAPAFHWLAERVPHKTAETGNESVPVSRTQIGIGDKIISPDDHGKSLTSRLESNRAALRLWSSAPIFGTGLGSFMAREKMSPGPDAGPMQIHNTSLWLLTEFGLVGFAIFAGTFAAFFLFLYRTWKARPEQSRPGDGILLAGLLIMPAWVGVSMFHELMYQRLPWFLLGLCAAAAFTPPRSGFRPRRSSPEKFRGC